MLNRTPPPEDPFVIGPGRFRPMDEQGIDIEALSINPFWYSAERDLAVEQLEEGVKKLGLRAASLGANINGDGVAKAPGGQRVSDQRNWQPARNSIALSHLIFDGVLDRFPALKICAAHGGGYLPSYASRSDHGCVTFPNSCTHTLKKEPTDYLKQLYFDSLVSLGLAQTWLLRYG